MKKFIKNKIQDLIKESNLELDKVSTPHCPALYARSYYIIQNKIIFLQKLLKEYKHLKNE